MENIFITNKQKGPREKLEEMGVRALSDKELIMVLLSKGTQGHTLEEISQSVLGIIDKNNSPALSELKCIPGVGDAKASTILAALELGRRGPGKKTKVLKNPKDIWNEVRHYGERNQEQLLVLSFNGAGELISKTVATIGLVDRVVMHPREIFAKAIEERAVGVVIVHNHPSGNLRPSNEDRILTQKITSAGKLLGIKVVDHLIITAEGYYSFREKGERFDE